MEPNTHSTPGPTRPASGAPDRLAALANAVEELAARGHDGLSDAALVERVLALRRLLDGLEGHWLQTPAAVDARGAAGADHGVRAASTASWLRPASAWAPAPPAPGSGPLGRCSAAPSPKPPTPRPAGELSPAHAAVLAAGTQELPPHTAMDAEPVLLEAAHRLDPPRLGRVVGHLQLVADPDNADHRSQRRYERRGLWLAATWEGMVAIQRDAGPRAGQLVAAALEPLARPPDAQDTPSGGQRNADALAELARRALEGGRLPQAGGGRPS